MIAEVGHQNSTAQPAISCKIEILLIQRIAPSRLNLEPCFTPVESPESNGPAEAFVKTFKRDCIRTNPLPDARPARTDRSLDGRLQL